jgi:hypothetical protein
MAQAQELPSDEGVYSIWQGERCIYVGDGGQESGIRGRIVPHHINKAHGRFGNATKDTAGWREGRSQPWWDTASWEIEYVLCSNPVHRTYLEGAMLLEFEPWCNDQTFRRR